MCSFLFVRSRERISDTNISEANRIGKYRGPDSTSTLRQIDSAGFHIIAVHNLLDISGHAVSQPVARGGQQDAAFLCFNGEIYNYRQLATADSDTDALISIYPDQGIALGKCLDGEFAAVIYDSATNQLHYWVDPFLTKPLFFGCDAAGEMFGLATNASALRALGMSDVSLAEANSSGSISFTDARIAQQKSTPLREFDLTQHVEDYERWERAFIQSVRKRATHGVHKPVVFLSSGYDSGAICLALNLLGIEYTTWSIEANENQQVLNDRINLNRDLAGAEAFRIAAIDELLRREAVSDIAVNVEPFQYVHEDAPGVFADFQADGGALGGWLLARHAATAGCRVVLSGSGADEILSDYGFAGDKFYYHSEFGGAFPEDLESVFPWKKFYGDTQRSYLFKDEYILGRFGIEGRYPFLDFDVVQEFLWLKPKQKNAAYKAPLDAFLRRHGYPFEENQKRGFCPSVQPVASAPDRPRGWFERVLSYFTRDSR